VTCRARSRMADTLTVLNAIRHYGDVSEEDTQRTPPFRLSRADAHRRTAEAWRLRTEQGLAWDEIAERVGYANGQNAMRACRRWRQGLPSLDVERMRDEAIGRAEWLVRKAAEDVEQDRPGCVTAMVRAEGRLAALCGLDAPRRTVSETYEERVSAVFAWLRSDEPRPPWELEDNGRSRRSGWDG
jgi:hypothetical protein